MYSSPWLTFASAAYEARFGGAVGSMPPTVRYLAYLTYTLVPDLTKEGTMTHP